MRLERIGIIVGIVAGVVAIWYYLRGAAKGPVQVSYPNNQASGVPASQNASSTFNIQALQRSPDPSLIYGAPPPLPPTPSYQSFNYSPVNLLGLTPQGATAVTKTATPGKAGTPDPVDKSSCGCGGGCGSPCGCASGTGTFGDGSSLACLAANPAEQAASMSSTQLGNLARNINSLASPSPSEQGLPPTGTAPVSGSGPAQKSAKPLPSQATQPAPAPPSSGGFLPWSVAGKLLGLNPSAQNWYEQSAGFTGNG